MGETTSRTIQRTCECGGPHGAATGCERCGRRSPLVPRRATDSARPLGVAGVVDDVLRSAGAPLGPRTRLFMESRLGHDFGAVRVHADAGAAASARAMSASAYTAGRDIVFADGQYAPESPGGRALLAHELTHVVQQHSVAQVPQRASDLAVGPVGDAAEHEAETVAADLVSGRPVAAITSRPGAPVLSRVPWGTCPTGRRVPAGSSFLWNSAELWMVNYYTRRRERASNVVASNRDRLEDLATTREPEATMLEALQTHFRGGGNPSAIRPTSVEPPGELPEASGAIPSPEEIVGELEVDGEPVAPGVLAEIMGGQADLNQLFNLLRPDIMDLTRRDVYDVTTPSQAAVHAMSILGYVGLLTKITGRGWDAGTDLPAPSPLAVPNLPRPELICFGPTDFTRYPGVILYEIVDPSTPDDDKKKKQDDADKKKAGTEPEKPHADDGRRPAVHDPDGLRAASDEAAEAARRAERETAELVEKEFAEAAAKQGDTPVRRFLTRRMPTIVSERLARIAASKSAQRAASLVPVLGWGFAGFDAYQGVQDVLNGNVLRGLTAVGCATGDVASDFLHLGDAVTGPGGTAASLLAQGGLISCQIAIEVSRAYDLLKELEQEIADTGALPSDERLRDYYGLDDEAMAELKSGFAEESAAEATP